MLFLAVIAAAIVADYVQGVSSSRGSLSFSSRAIDLKSEHKTYTVNCTLHYGTTGNNIQFLRILEDGSRLDTETISDSTISYTANQNHSKCGEIRYTCEYFGAKIDEQVVSLGEAPTTINSTKFKCISENLSYLHCHFPASLNHCQQLGTSYSLLMISSGSFESCKLTKVGDSFRFDSRDQSCQYPPDVDDEEVIEFRLRATNQFGSAAQKILVDHYDVVRPAAPHSVDLAFGDEEKMFFLSWKSKKNLNYFGRKFQYNFRCQNESWIESKRMISRWPLGKTFLCRQPKVRLRVVPENSKLEGSWSDWGVFDPYSKGSAGRSAYGTTNEDEHEEDRVTGVFNYIEVNNQSMTIEVFWQRESSWTGSNLVAISETGATYKPSWNDLQPTFGRAKFYNLKHEKYSISLEGDQSEEISPPKGFNVQPISTHHQPKFKKLLNNNKSFEVSWFPPPNPDDLQGYTVMYCHLTATSVCEESVVFQKLPKTDTSFNIYSEKTLNFAVSAEYPNYTSSLVWQQCIVSPTSNTHNKSPKFHFFDVSSNSVKLRLDSSCEDRSLYELLHIHVIDSSTGNPVTSRTSQPHESVVEIADLEPDTSYEVLVVAYNSSNVPHEARLAVNTAKTGSDNRLTISFVTGLLIALVITSTYRVTVRIRAIMNIEVEFPFGLLGIDEEPVRVCVESNGFSSKGVDHNYVVMDRNRAYLEVVQEEEIGDDLGCGRCGVTPSKLVEFEENAGQQQDVGYLSVDVIMKNGI